MSPKLDEKPTNVVEGNGGSITVSNVAKEDAHTALPDQSKAEAGPKEGGMRDYFRVFTFASPLDILLNVIGTMCAIGAGVTLPLMTIVFGGFVTKFTAFGKGQVSPAAFRDEVDSYTLWFVYLFISKFCLTYGYVTLFTITALRTTKNMRSRFMEATLRQDVAFFDNVGPGSIAVKTTTNANLVNAGIAEKLGRLIQSLSMMTSALIVAFVQNWQLTLIVGSLVPPLFLILGVTMTIDANIEGRILRIYSQASSLAEELLGSIKTVRAFGAGEKLLLKYDEWLQKASVVGHRKSVNLAVMFGGEFFFSYAPYSLAFWQGARLYLSGEIESVGLVVNVVFSVLMVAAAVSQVAPIVETFIRAASAASELFDTLDREPASTSHPGSEPNPSSISGKVEFHNVSFSYPSRPSVPILRNVSFEAPANQVTALVGASGSGKSTTIALLERWYEPSDGVVAVDGQRIDHLDAKWLRSNMRLVQQEPVLFNDTIFNNIIQGLTGTEHEFASYEKKKELVLEASKAANASEFIETLNEGYDTNVGERAGLLSGGQKQRIAIARSIISNPRILLLDEATSALDAHSEGIVQNALDRVSKSRTTIVIAHKLATVMKADNIIVLDRGQIIEQGTHQQLLVKDGAYAKLVHAQDLGDSKNTKSVDDDSNDAESSSDEVIGEMIQRRTTTAQSYGIDSQDGADGQPTQRSLIRCLIILLGENGSLWHWYLASAVAALIGGGTFPAQAILLSRLITSFEKPADELRDNANFFSLMFLMVAIITLCAYGLAGFASNVMSQFLTRRYRHEMLQSLVRQDISFFDKPENAAAALTSRLSTNPTGLQDLLGINLTLIAVVFVNLSSNTILALAIGWKLGLVVFFGALPLIFGSGYLRIRLETKFDNQNASLFADSARFASEAVGAMRTVVSFTLEDSVCKAYEERLQSIVKSSYGNTMTKMVWYALAESIELLAMALAFWYGSRLLADGEYTTGQFFIIFTAIVFGGQAAGQFFAWTPNMTKAHAAANYILDLRYSEAIIKDDPDCSQPDPDSGYTFNKVHFRYPLRKHVPVLQGLNLEIKPGTSVAFVGGSGCGKSTTIGLLERYYDPTRGSICFGSESLPKLHLSSYRSNISLVSQEPTLYQGSIYENISLGAVGPVSEEQIAQAARDSNIYDFIMSLPEGMGTDCGGRGMQLSGGQKQRIAIARALVRNPKILLLDEATSALDTTSEKLVQESLRNAAHGRTTISVAHRLSTVRDCSKIFVFENGTVVEAGTHRELLELNGRYQKMCEAQSLDAAA